MGVVMERRDTSAVIMLDTSRIRRDGCTPSSDADLVSVDEAANVCWTPLPSVDQRPQYGDLKFPGVSLQC